jgi:hypothetical protein
MNKRKFPARFRLGAAFGLEDVLSQKVSREKRSVACSRIGLEIEQLLD